MSVVVETKGHLTRSGPMPAAGVGGDYSADLITKACLNLIAKLNEASVEDEVSWIPRLGNITVAATKFEDCSRMPQTASVANFFGKRKAVINSEQAQTVSVTSEPKDQVVNDDVKEQNCEITSEELSDIELVKCERCSEMVSPFELPEHLDYHVAQDANKKDCSTIPQTSSIAKFFEKKQADVTCDEAESSPVTYEQKDQVSSDSEREQNCESKSEKLCDVELIKCERCSEMVSPFELPEHLDYHVAQDVSAQMRREVVQEQRNLQASKMAPSSGKRKKNTHTVEPDPKKQRNISAFFTKK